MKNIKFCRIQFNSLNRGIYSFVQNLFYFSSLIADVPFLITFVEQIF